MSKAAEPTMRMTITVYFCPNGESVADAVSATKLHLIEEDTFEELLGDVARYFGEQPFMMNLRDAHGAIYPLGKQVWREVKDDEVIRLVGTDVADKEEVAEKQEAALEETQAVDFGMGSKTHRQPLIRELVIHALYTTLLMLWVFALIDTQWAYQVGAVVDKQFVQARMSTGKNFNQIVTFRDVVVWMDESLQFGLFSSDSDYSGSLFKYDRVVGGIEFKYVHVNIENPDPNADDFEKTLVREGDQTFEEMLYINPDLTMPDVIDFALNQSSFAKIVPGQLTNLTKYVNQTWLRTPSYNLNRVGWDCGCFSLMRELRIRFTLYNPNVELYVNAEYKFRQTEEGLVKPEQQMKIFPMHPPWTGLPPKEGSTWYKRLALWIFGAFYVMVLITTRTLVKLSRAVKKREGSYKYFFLNGWTLLQLFTNVINYFNLALCISYSYYQLRRDWDPYSVTSYVDLTNVGNLYSYINFISAVSIFCSFLLFTHFFELAPQTSMWYVTATSLARAGNSVFVAGFLCVLLLLGFAILANNVYGLRMFVFSTLYRSIVSLVRLLMGDDAIYHEMATSRPNVGALIFLIVFLAVFYFMILPLFIAIMTDAYFLRQQINEELIVHIQGKAEEKYKAAEAQRKRKRGGVH